MRAALVALALALAACDGSPAIDPVADIAAIEAGMHARFDRPDAKLFVGPVAVSGAHAVADWSQDGMGGRALLERRNGRWEIVLCSGASLKGADYLRQARVPQGDAIVIARRLAQLETGLDPAWLAKIDGFNGTVMAADMATPDPRAGHDVTH